MDPAPRPSATAPHSWSPAARRLGIAGGVGILAVGVAYLAVIAAWLVLEGTPREPIGDPYLMAMEILTILSGAALLATVLALTCFVDRDRRVFALGALATGTLAAGTTLAVHFVQLTAVRQLWRQGALPDYRLVWPSPLFAVEYFAWDALVGTTMILGAAALAGLPGARGTRAALWTGGGLCLAGTAGPFWGNMALQNVAVAGYALVLPVGAGLLARLFHRHSPVPPGDGP